MAKYYIKFTKIIYILIILNFNIMESISKFELKSNSLKEGERIDIKYTCKGENISPDIYWVNSPKDTQSYALIIEDFDAKEQNPFTHWIIFNIPKNINHLNENEKNYTNGFNSYNVDYYKGPCPPFNEIHNYKFTIFALSKEHFNPSIGKDRETFLKNIQNYIIDKAYLNVKFSR
jgi:Raf kinase inhibitor-like YbhB/YbcL family protein